MEDTARKRAKADVSGLSSARRRAILSARTEALARPIEVAEETGGGLLALVCAVGESLYGLPVAQVSRIKPFAAWSATVGRHPALLGLVADAGGVRPVYDLARLLAPNTAGEASGGWLAILAPPHTAALRLAELPIAAGIEPLDDSTDRGRVSDGDHAGKLLVLLSPETLLAPLSPALHGALAL